MAEINEGIKKMIEENALAFATTDKQGNPHNIAVACVKVVSKDELIITDNYMKTTIENLKKNNNVSLAVWNNDIGFNLEGTATYYNSGKWLEYVKKLEDNKGLPAKGAILVTINKIKVLGG